MAKLVIVESPAKAKTIGKYLGDDYEVTASMGHIRDLPASQLGIDVEHGYTPQYISIKGKEKLIKELKSKAKHADGVLLATDPDREGEAISWHLANILGLDPHEPNRVTFDEITKKGVKEGMAHPRAIDEDLFNAQQARRVLDRLVGYKLSPFLWRKVRRGLSAGRVQSVAVRLIDDREKEIENFKPDEYWNVDATLGAGHKSFVARLASSSGFTRTLIQCSRTLIVPPPHHFDVSSAECALHGHAALPGQTAFPLFSHGLDHHFHDHPYSAVRPVLPVLHSFPPVLPPGGTAFQARPAQLPAGS